MNKKAVFILSTSLLVSIGVVTLTFGSSDNFNAIADNDVIEHYDGVAPTLESEGKREHWASCLSHKRWTDQNKEFEVSDEDLIIAKKTEGIILEEETVKQIEIKTINPLSFENVDQIDATYYSIDSRESLYLSSSIKNNGYSKFTFNISTPATIAFGFDYKMYDLNTDRSFEDGLLFSKGKYSQKINKASSYVKIKSGSDYRYVEKDLIPDNNWHTMLAKFKDNIQIDEISIYIKNFVGEIYISDLTVNAMKTTIRANGTNANGIYLNTPSDNGVPAPGGTWNYLSSQTMAGAVLKNDQGFNQTSNKILFKLLPTTYYLALADNNQTATENDIIQLNGIFRYTDENRIYSYILLSSKMVYGNGTFVNCATSIEGYAIGQNGNGGTTGFYLNNTTNDAANLPISGWSGSAFKPSRADCLIIDGINYGANNPTNNTFLKLTVSSFYMALDRQNAHNSINEGSVIEVDGIYLFDDGETKVNIEFNSVVLIYTGEKWSLYNFDYHFNGSGAYKGESETAGTAGGLYFSLAKNAIPHSSSGNVWNTYRLIPSSINNIKLLRNNNQYAIARIDSLTIDKYGANGTYYYLEFSRTNYSNYNGPTNGDILIIGGDFSNTFNGATYTLNINEFYAYFTGSKWIVCQSIGQVEDVVMGISKTHNASTAIYIRMDDNNIPYNHASEDWNNYKLSPLTNDCLAISRNDLVTNIGLVDTLQMIKFTQYQYYLDLKPSSTNIHALEEGDVLTIKGYWKYTSGEVSHLINISPSKFKYDGTKWDLYYESTDVEMGNATLGNGINNATNIPLTFSTNNLPLADYSLSNGEVTLNDIIINPTLVKIDNSNYLLTLSSNAMMGDILVINGTFTYNDSSSRINYNMTISLSTFIFDGTNWRIAEFGGTY